MKLFYQVFVIIALMNCNYFNTCGGCVLPAAYEHQLNLKTEKFVKDFQEFQLPKLEIFSSKESHFRNRAEFRIFRVEEGICKYAMHTQDKKLFPIEECPIVNEKIYSLMPKILEKINDSETLKRKLFAIEFLTTEYDTVLVTLIYHRPIDEKWKEEALQIQNELNIFIIGRSRKVKEVLEKETLTEKLEILGKEYGFIHRENSFTQPNGSINKEMIGWAKKASLNFEGDLLELYCGMGNFTIPLSENFNRVLATEISKSSIKSAKENCELNNVFNISFLRMSSEEFNEAWEGKREFRRLQEQDIELKDYDFQTIFVDPPRAGLDDKSRGFASGFENIIYISCNPETLKRDLQTLTKSHKIVQFALFDQFPYTNHIESGVILKKC